ncbi:MAG TPA: PKD domain-containing protein [Candidatus Limnocylindrales bacterium]|nr:PKD domain-containing protein [Candidatus Limnocylindrales bacterium]
MRRSGARSRPSARPGDRPPAPATGPADRGANSRGQALVELALILPVLLLLLLGAIDFGRVFYSQITVNDAAREGALEGTRNPTSFLAGTACTSANKESNRIMCRTLNEAKGGFVTVAPADVSVSCSTGTCPSSPSLGQTISVAVAGRMTLLTPFIGAIFGSQDVLLSGSATAQLNAAPSVTGTAPAASFDAAPTSGPAPLSVTFTDTSTGGPVTWSWDFGNGQVSGAQGPHTIVYSAQGTYTVKLTVSNAGGITFTTRTITVGPAVTGPPVAAISATPATSGAAPLTVTFADLSTGTPTSWAWDFGNGQTSTQQNPGAVTYNAVGTFTVTLTATNASGSSQATTTVTTNAACLSPAASFTVNPTTGKKKQAQFTVTDGSSNMATAGCNAQWSWDFGDGQGSTLQAPPAHVYDKQGTYTIQLTVSNLAGSSTTTRQVTVTP